MAEKDHFFTCQPPQCERRLAWKRAAPSSFDSSTAVESAGALQRVKSRQPRPPEHAALSFTFEPDVTQARTAK
eukprot:COSAG06_NODE_884_length_11783_cov_10.515919_2_plen_73_part_00